MTDRYDWCWEDSVSHAKVWLDPEHRPEHRYVPFRTNRYLSRFMDSLAQAQEMNLLPSLDARLQYDYLFNAVRKRKRFQKGGRAAPSNDAEAIAAHYKYSAARVREALSILTKEQVALIRKGAEKGG